MAAARKTKSRKPNRERYWSGRVSRESEALDLEGGVFLQDSPRKIAASLKRSADRSRRRKTTSYRSALSMLTFYINRAGNTLSGKRKRLLERAKGELKSLFGKNSARKKSSRKSAKRAGAERTRRSGK